MMRRVEIAWPILDAQMQARVMQECLLPYLEDTEDAWVLAEDRQYKQLFAESTFGKKLSTQKTHIQTYTAQ
jgi:polyphosphate kinase